MSDDQRDCVPGRGAGSSETDFRGKYEEKKNKHNLQVFINNRRGGRETLQDSKRGLYCRLMLLSET